MDPLQQAQENISDHMDGILENFKGDLRIIVAVWDPNFPDQDFVMTNADLEDARGVIERRIERGHEA